ncbi:hypothetical protein NL676_025996 [Syzygium grande]|nr:hypothetical protein NL676_025996 [Syzygium grande]
MRGVGGVEEEEAATGSGFPPSPRSPPVVHISIYPFPFIMSDWDPHWSSPPPLSPPSASHDEAPSSDAPAAESRDDSPPLASLQAAAAPPATAVTSHGGSSPMSHLNTYIKEYLVQLGLSDLASLFMEEAKKNADIPPVPFVQMWFQLESQMIPCSPPSYDKQMVPMFSLNEGVEKYLEHLQIDRRSFSEKAS